ncbi:MAG: methyltransferase [Promethearchaeota archaeon]
MKIVTIEDVKNLLRMYIPSAALSAALELHLFKQLNESPQSVQSISKTFDIPLDRCRCWLDLLVGLDLLERKNGIYSPSSVAQTTLIQTYSHETWSQLAQEGRERYLLGNDLILHISHPRSVWEAQGKKPPDWFKQIEEDTERARRFTRMLYELHQPLGKTLAQILDMSGVKRLMDLGGGSGVISLALLEQNPDLTAVVVDIPNICIVGREIAATTTAEDRIIYHAANILQDELPTGFDMILDCDAGFYSEEILSKLYGVLNKNGHLVIVDWWNRGITDSQPAGESSLQHLMQRFESSLEVSSFTYTVNTLVKEIKNRLSKAGFSNITEQTLEDKTMIIRARKV